MLLGWLYNALRKLHPTDRKGRPFWDPCLVHLSGFSLQEGNSDQQAQVEALPAVSCRICTVRTGFKTANDTRIWVITEAADDNGERAATTLLLPEEY